MSGVAAPAATAPSTPAKSSPKTAAAAGQGGTSGKKRPRDRGTPSSGKSSAAKKSKSAAASSSPGARATRNGGEHREGALADSDAEEKAEAAAAAALETVTRRAFWERYASAPTLLFTWLHDYPQGVQAVHPVHSNDAERIITALVNLEIPTVTADGAAITLANLQENYRERTDLDPPGLGDPAESRPSSPESEPLEPSDVDEEEEEEAPEAPRAAPKGAAAAAAAAGPAACRTCATQAPAGHAAEWMCPCCHLRGDLATDQGSNVFLAKKLLQADAAPSAAPSAAAAASSSGQPKLTRVDEELKRLAAVELRAPATLNAIYSDAATITPEAALERIRRAYGAVRDERCSSHLLLLIRSGRFAGNHLGFALPRSAEAAAKADTAQPLATDSQGQIIISRGVVTAPPIASLRDFAAAFVSNIAPALIDRPAALLDWLTLFRSILQIDAEKGWPTAMSYATLALNDAIPIGAAFATFSETILAEAAKAPVAASQALGSAATAAGGSPFARETCADWNTAAGCPRQFCKYRHACKNVSSCRNTPPGHKASACPQPFSQSHPRSDGYGASRGPYQQQSRSYGGGGGSGGGGGHRGSSVASSRTAATAPAAAAHKA
jgi:uncharacterized membrane protein YgcG